MASIVSELYAPCPCGSGKKVKFCCNRAIREMDRVAQFHDKGQIEPALQAINLVQQKHPEAAIVALTRAQLLMEASRFTEASNEMRLFLAAHPENGNGAALLAFAHYMDVGFHQAKPEIHRALQVAQHSTPDVLASLAIEIGNELQPRNPMAAREYFALALRLTTDASERQSLFSQLMRLDGSTRVPYPLRGTHQLEKIEAPEGFEKDVKNAYRLSLFGCWGIAAKLFRKVSEKVPENWAIWKNIGLCQIWDDDTAGAAEAFHKAAELCADQDVAIECETLGQLFDAKLVEDPVKFWQLEYLIRSASKTMSLLDDAKLIYRKPAPTRGNDESVVAQYVAIDRPLPADDVELTDATTPIAIGSIRIIGQFDENRTEGVLVLNVLDGEDRDAVTKLLDATLGDEILSWSILHDHDDGHDCGHDHDDAAANRVIERLQALVLRELLPLYRSELLEFRLKGRAFQEHLRKLVRRVVNETWVNTPLKRLNGATPREAVGKPELRVKLAAAVALMESTEPTLGLGVDMHQFRIDMQVATTNTVPATDENLNALSVMQSHRLALQDLTEDQLGHVAHRALLIRYMPFVLAVFEEAQRRGLDQLRGMDKGAFAQTLAEVHHEMCNYSEAVRWAAKCSAELEKGDDFKRRLSCVTREFEYRAEDPSDPELPNVIDRLWNYYGVKLPSIREALRAILPDLKLPIPGETQSGIVLPESMVAGATSGSPASKLWIPE